MMKLSKLALIEQTFPEQRINHLNASLLETFSTFADSPINLSGMRIAVAVGSRGISRIDEILRHLINFLKSKGSDPFIVPAMGSHGGATEEGQRQVLESYGISSQSMGVEVVSSLTVKDLGKTKTGVPVKIDRQAWNSDGIILVNRIKPHTDFKGALGSGLMKMIAVGLGNLEGAGDFHSAIRNFSHEEVITSKASLVLASGKILGGLAIVENASHELARVEAILGERIEEREKVLFRESAELMPALPVETLDLLIIDQIGKDISGAGMDPNVTGRWFRLNSRWQEKPEIGRILVRDLSKKTKGNGLGIGLSDFCTLRTVEKMDLSTTYANAITSQNTVTAQIPLYFDSDREMLEAAVKSLGASIDPSRLRLIRIRDTLHLNPFWASESLVEDLKISPRVTKVSKAQPLSFDRAGNILEN